MAYEHEVIDYHDLHPKTGYFMHYFFPSRETAYMWLASHIDDPKFPRYAYNYRNWSEDFYNNCRWLRISDHL